MSTASSSLGLFWDLASSSQPQRLGSSAVLVESLLTQQRSLTSDGIPQRASPAAGEDEEVSTYTSNHCIAEIEETERVARRLDARFAADVGYSLRRLVKGLASPRESARLGFAVALAELLEHLPTLPASDILVLILQHSATDAKQNGREERAQHFARLFGLLALVRSGALFRQNATERDVQRAVEVLLDLGGKKAWLAEGTAWVLCALVEGLGKAAVAWKNDAADWIVSRLRGVEFTPEKLALALQLRATFPALNLSVILPPLKGSEIFAHANLPILARVLKNATPAPLEEEAPAAAGQKGNNATGNYKTQVHFVWSRILDAYFPEGASAAPTAGRAPFSELFRVCVDESLFATVASPERKAWGFQVFQMALPRAPAPERPMLFTPNFMRSWINQLGKKDRLLHAAALQAASVVQDVVKADPTSGFTLVSQLLGTHGSQYFDKLTGTKTVESLLAAMDAAGVRQYIDYLVHLASDAPTEGTPELQHKGSVARRKWAFDQLLVLVRNGAIPKDDACVRDILSFFAAHGFFALRKPLKGGVPSLSVLPKPAFSDELRTACRARFLSCLADLSGQTTVLSDLEGKVRKAQGTTSTGALWIGAAFDILTAFEADEKHFAPVVKRAEEAAEARTNALATLKTVRKLAESAKESAQRDRARSFESLLLAALLVTHDGTDEGDDLLEPLTDCADRLFASPAAKAKRSKPTDDDEEAEPEPIELLVDCLVAFLERSSAFLRTIASQALATFASEMTEASLDHLLDQLGVNEEPEEDDAMDVDGVVGPDAEMLDEEMSNTSATSNSGQDSDDDEYDEEDDDDAEDEDVDPELVAAVEAALRASGMADKDGSGDEESSDDDEEDDELLDDEQMMQLDDKLAEIFRERVGAKKQDTDAKREAVVFQSKVLDLLDVFARKEASSPLVVRLVGPLFTIIQETDKDAAQVAARASTILRGTLGKSKEHPVSVPVAAVLPTLQELHAVARKTTLPEIQSLSSVANLYLTASVFAKGGEALPAAGSGQEELLALYTETLSDFLTRKACALKPAFLIDAFRRFPLLGWSLRQRLTEACSPSASTNAFRQAQAFSMLQAALTQASQSKTPAVQKELHAFLPEISALVLSTVQTAAAIPSTAEGQAATGGIKADRLKEVLKFGLATARLTKRVAGSDGKGAEAEKEVVERVWRASKIRAAAEALEKSERFGASKGLHALLKQLLAIVEGPSQPKEKKAKEPKTADAAAASTNGKAAEATVDTKKAKVKRSSAGAAAEAPVKKRKKSAAA